MVTTSISDGAGGWKEIDITAPEQLGATINAFERLALDNLDDKYLVKLCVDTLDTLAGVGGRWGLGYAWPVELAAIRYPVPSWGKQP